MKFISIAFMALASWSCFAQPSDRQSNLQTSNAQIDSIREQARTIGQANIDRQRATLPTELLVIVVCQLIRLCVLSATLAARLKADLLFRLLMTCALQSSKVQKSSHVKLRRLQWPQLDRIASVRWCSCTP